MTPIAAALAALVFVLIRALTLGAEAGISAASRERSKSGGPHRVSWLRSRT